MSDYAANKGLLLGKEDRVGKGTGYGLDDVVSTEIALETSIVKYILQATYWDDLN